MNYIIISGKHKKVVRTADEFLKEMLKLETAHKNYEYRIKRR